MIDDPRKFKNTTSGDVAIEVGERGGAIVAKLLESDEYVRITIRDLFEDKWILVKDSA